MVTSNTNKTNQSTQISLLGSLDLTKFKELSKLLNTFSKQFINNSDSVLTEQNKQYIMDLQRELKANSRLQYNCAFWASFYFFGLMYVINKTRMKLFTDF